MVNKCQNPEDKRNLVHTTPISSAEKDLLKDLAVYLGTSKSGVIRQALFALALDKGFTLPSSAKKAGNVWNP